MATKNTCIEESKDLRLLPIEELIGYLLTYEMKIKRLNEMEDEDKGRKGITLKVNEEDQASSSNNEDKNGDDEDMALVIKKFKKFYKKGFNKRGKKPLSKKGQSSSLFKARCFECNSTDHLVADCPKAIEKEKGDLKTKLETIKNKKKGKGLIGAW
ncbi:hypothetical protein M9H77_06845 [Catharanthus roseus]|uniref:Uncharacterized protein n=1 Tax=Catharanthus roseus TaxID=4058 RepID=A0ACC0BTA1_CATRO|nr:hypothetical protein M9H77_06845 [Catharanthus roseus]